VVENGVIELVLGGEMAENHRLGNARRPRYLLGRRAPKTVL
jgi:hypothetical protein